MTATALTIIVALIAAAISYYVGIKQGRAAEHQLQLSIGQARPRIGSRVEFCEYDPGPEIRGVRGYSIKTKIYNDGTLVASKLDGNWKLSSSYTSLEATQVIRADSLPSSLPLELHHDLGNHTSKTFTKPDVVLKLDIDLVYLGFEDKPEKYRVSYQYDPKSQKMIQVAEDQQ